MKKIKKRVIIITLIGIGAVFISIDWNNLIISNFNMNIKNQLKIAAMESNSNSDYMNLGPNMVVNYSGQVENKSEIYNELVNSSNSLLAKNSIYLNNEIIKVNFNEIKIMSGIMYYPVEVYTINDGVNRELEYSFYISLDANLMPSDDVLTTSLGIDKSVEMVNSFENDNEVNTEYNLSSTETSNYNNQETFDDSSEKLYYKLCQMAELNIFGTTYISGYNFISNLSAPINYKGEEYYEILMYNTKRKNSFNGGLMYKFYMTASGNIVDYSQINTTDSNNITNSSVINKANTISVITTNKNKSETNNKNDISEGNTNKNSINTSETLNEATYNSIYKLVLEYENLVVNTKQNYDFKINSYKVINGVNYYNININDNKNLVDEFYISNNGIIYRENKETN